MERKHTAYVLMGYPGSGKSHLASRLLDEDGLGFPEASYLYSLWNRLDNPISLSSDDLREELYGFRDQTHNKEVFEELYKRAIEHFSEGDVIIDSTALTRKDRLRVVNNLKKYYELELICVVAPIEQILEINAQRKGYTSDAYIPEDILKQILGRFQLPTSEEGWSEIHFVYNNTFPCYFLSDEELDNYSYSSQVNSLKFNLEKHWDLAHDNPHHSETVKEHINYLLDYVPEDLRRIAYYHDVGKFYVRTFNEEKGYHQFIGHAAVSTYIYLTDALLESYLNWTFNDRYPDRAEVWGRIDYDREDWDIRDHFRLEERSMKVFYYPEDYIIGDRLVNLYPLYDNAFLTEIYAIYYHDQPYACDGRDHLIKSLSKPSKYLVDNFGEHLEDFADILLEFNSYDRMRENEDEQDS